MKVLSFDWKTGNFKLDGVDVGNRVVGKRVGGPVTEAWADASHPPMTYQFELDSEEVQLQVPSDDVNSMMAIESIDMGVPTVLESKLFTRDYKLGVNGRFYYGTTIGMV